MLESRGQLALAERFLHAMRAAYPEVLASIRTKQVAQEMLHFKAEYIAELCSSGEWRCYKQPAAPGGIALKAQGTGPGAPATSAVDQRTSRCTAASSQQPWSWR